jgi:hypothetical protein
MERNEKNHELFRSFLGVKWKYDEDKREYHYKRWVMDPYYDEGWIVMLYYDPPTGFQVQVELTGYGKSAKSALNDLGRQLAKVVGLTQP